MIYRSISILLALMYSFLMLVIPATFFLSIVPAVVVAVSSYSVMQEKVRISPERGSSDMSVVVSADSMDNVKIKCILPAENRLGASGCEVVCVGCLLPLSGLYADYGLRFLQGIELALGVYSGDELRQGRRIKLLVRDTRGMADVVIPLVHELAEVEQVSLFIGPVMGSVSQRAAKEASALHIPIITLTPKSGIAAMGRLVFQHFITARNQAEELVRFIAENSANRQVVLLSPDTLFGRNFSNCFTVAASRERITLVQTIEYQSSATDFGVVIKKIIDSQEVVDKKRSIEKLNKNNFSSRKKMVLVLPGNSRRLNMLLPQLAHYGLDNVQLFGSRGWDDLICADEFLLHTLDKRLFFVDAFSASVENMPAPLLQYCKRYEQQFKKKASLYDAYGYDTVMLIKQVVDRLFGWPVSGEHLAAAIQTLPEMEMVTGITTLRPDGEIEKQLYRFVAEKGTVTIFSQIPPLF